MKKYYAESTLARKYAATGIPRETIEKVRTTLDACAAFYRLLPEKDVRLILRHFCGITSEQFGKLLPILYRDENLNCGIEYESEFFEDGSKEKMLFFDFDLTMRFLDYSDPEVRKEYLKPGMKLEDRPLFEEYYDDLYALYEETLKKPLYIPADLLRYSDSFYYEDTPQARAMIAFIRDNLKRKAGKNRPRRSFPDPAVEALALLIEHIRFDSVFPSMNVQEAVFILEDLGYRLGGVSEMEQFTRLLTDLMNNTRIPFNRGYTPVEMRKKTR